MIGAPDAPAMFRVVDQNRLHLREWLPWVDAIQTVEDELAFIVSAEKSAADGIAFHCAIRCEGAIAGGIGIHPIDKANRKVEIGYWLAAEHQGKGLMTRACGALVDYLFQAVGLNRVVIYCGAGNRKSRAIPERLGFQQEGIHREAEWLYDHFVDLVCYSMLYKDWGSATKRDARAEL